ncbi:MAG: hypothetical protein QM749_01660 [Aquabacterium sp.]
MAGPKDLFDEVWTNIKARVENPFLSSFLISWIFVNYKVLIVLFGEGSYAPKIEYIESFLYGDVGVKWWSLLGVPLGFAIFYTFIWPFFDIKISQCVEIFANMKQKSILTERRKMHIDVDEQAQYFEKFDREIADAKSKVAGVYASLLREREESNKKIANLQPRLRRQTLLRLATPSGVSVDNIVALARAELSYVEFSNEPLFF